MKKILKTVDKFSKDFNFTHKGKNKFQTELGGILTIISYMVILFNGYLIGKDIFYKENPTVLTYEENVDYSPLTRINYKNMFFGFSFSKNFETYDYGSTLTILPYFNIAYYNKNHTLKNKRILLELTNCTSELERLNITPPYVSGIFDTMKCIKNFDYVLSGTLKDSPFQFLYIDVRACKNESSYSNEDSFDENEKGEFLQSFSNLITSNQLKLKYFSDEFIEENKKIIKSTIYSKMNNSISNVKCKSENEINDAIDKIYFDFYFNKISFNLKSYLNPINSVAATDYAKLGNNLYKEINLQINNYILSTDVGIIFNEPLPEDLRIGFKPYSIDISTKEKKDDYLMSIGITISNNIQYLNRDYIKIQTIFANMGGIMKLIFFIFQILYDPILNKKLNLKIINKIFRFHRKNLTKNIEKINNTPKSDYHINSNNLEKIINNNQEKNIIDKYDISNSERLNINIQKLGKKISKKKFEIIEKKANSSKNHDIRMNIHENSNLNNTNSKFEINKNIYIEKKQKEKKLRYNTKEIIVNLYCRCLCKDDLLQKKNELFSLASVNLLDYTDYLNILYLHNIITKLKYFVFNSPQLKSFEYIDKPENFMNGIFHQKNEFAQVFSKEPNKDENLNEIIDYFKDRIKYRNMDKIDKKILDVIDPELKILICSD